jgi:N-ethylmaleimide reductase
MSASKLFDPYKLGNVTLTNRAVMAPLTRNRALAGFVPNPLAIEYYGQRASAGLLITERAKSRSRAKAIRTHPASTPRNRLRAGAR